MQIAPKHLQGHYLEAFAQHKNMVARSLMKEFLVRQVETASPSYFMRVITRNQLWSAFRTPMPDTILEMTDIGCKSAQQNGMITLKLWINCPEDIVNSMKTYTIVIDDVELPGEYFRQKTHKTIAAGTQQ